MWGALEVDALCDQVTFSPPRRREGPPGAGLLVTTGPPREWSVAHRLEVVRGRVVGDVPAERLALHVRAAVVEASPDACLDELGEWLRERVKRAHSGASGIHESARDLEVRSKPHSGQIAQRPQRIPCSRGRLSNDKPKPLG